MLLIYDAKKLYLDGKEWYLAGGDFHYFRTLPGGWRRRLELMKAFGLTVLQTYVPWNLHEPEKGQFDFHGAYGELDLQAFLALCKEVGLYVFIRPAPYICSECDFGGLPYWLLNDRDCQFRTMDEPYWTHVRTYTERLMKEIVPHLSTNGGNILAVALENEYGSFGMDREYLRAMQNLYIQCGVDVPMFTAGGPDMYKQLFGGFRDVWSCIDCGGNIPKCLEMRAKFQDDMPPYISEFWGGRSCFHGGKFARQSAEAVAERYKAGLDADAYINFYMFCGGTSFGFFSGANYNTFRADVPHAAKRYVPFVTSYDVDAPVTETGNATPKYHALRKILADKRGMSLDELPPVPADAPVQVAGEIHWTETREFFAPDVLEALTTAKKYSGSPRSMESMGQAYGWILYTAYIERNDDATFSLMIDGLQDRADIYIDGEYKGTYYRNRPYDPVQFRITAERARIDILVENMGRICYGDKMLYEKRGILGCVRLYRDAQAFVTGFENRSVPMTYETVQKAFATTATTPRNGRQPRLYKGTFTAETGKDTHLSLDLATMTRGCVFINGFNIGRYWTIGPQFTLYVPADLLKEQNTVEIFDLTSEGTIAPTFTDKENLDGLAENAEILLSKD